MIQADLIIILPEIVISICAMLALVGSVYTEQRCAGLAVGTVYRGTALWYGTVDLATLAARATVPLAACSKMMPLPGSAK